MVNTLYGIAHGEPNPLEAQYLDTLATLLRMAAETALRAKIRTQDDTPSVMTALEERLTNEMVLVRNQFNVYSIILNERLTKVEEVTDDNE